ncbi:holo-ACP synthase [Melghirimyces algeriensis]|uniref:Holo-[acyl-carrier-protein] synthase n=1 Tax=Melghirimyces algeriensis TaxID=910412 RepID=A0A521EYE7_9BACL|nr:holo-ACP synthase [Melghirimyces algeriensis]SMO88883.1 holo-[acyl-carrier-protein] synthase [Melghirimyces algeriensis]
MILGIGTDLVEISRIRKVGLDRLSKRILSEKEQKDRPNMEGRLAEWLAGRFAAKEAVAKAVGTGIGAMIGFQDILVHKDAKGKPCVAISPAVYQRLGWDEHVEIHLSVTHTKDYAIAFAVVESR